MIPVPQQTLRPNCLYHKIAMQYLFDRACVMEGFFVVWFVFFPSVLFLAHFKCQYNRKGSLKLGLG